MADSAKSYFEIETEISKFLSISDCFGLMQTWIWKVCVHKILFETHMWCLICLKHCMVSFPHLLVFYSFPCLLITFLLYFCIYLTLKNIHLFVSHFTNLYRKVLVSVNWYGIPNSLALVESTVIFHLLVNTPW